MRIAEDRGGQIGHYLQAFSMLRSSGERVVVDGNCLSACTLVLGIIPPSKVCATQRARFGFHAAWNFDDSGHRVHSIERTVPFGHQAGRVSDRGQEQPELGQERDCESHVAALDIEGA